MTSEFFFRKLKITVLVLCAYCVLLSSCALVTPAKQVSKEQDKVAKQEQKMEKTQNLLTKNSEEKSNEVSSLAFGIKYSLDQTTNAPVYVKTATDLNDRVISIVGSPRLDEIQKIKGMVDLLNSQVLDERKKGETVLAKKDKEIVEIQKQSETLSAKYDIQIKQLTEQNKALAKADDSKQATLNEMSGFMGLKAVAWGLKRFFISCITYLIVFAILFIIVSVLENTNPAFKAIMSLVNMAFGALIAPLKLIAPGSFSFCNLVHVNEKNKYKETLTEIVNVIQKLKENQKVAPDKTYPLSEVLDTLSSTLDKKYEDVVEEILKEEKWK